MDQQDLFALIRFSPFGEVRAVYSQANSDVEAEAVRKAVDRAFTPSPSAWMRRLNRWILRAAVRAWRRFLESRMRLERFDRGLSLKIDRAVKMEDRLR